MRCQYLRRIVHWLVEGHAGVIMGSSCSTVSDASAYLLNICPRARGCPLHLGKLFVLAQKLNIKNMLSFIGWCALASRIYSSNSSKAFSSSTFSTVVHRACKMVNCTVGFSCAMLKKCVALSTILKYNNRSDQLFQLCVVDEQQYRQSSWRSCP